MYLRTHTYIHTLSFFLSLSLSLFSNYTSSDQKREAVILPIFGMATPFHISTVKNTSYNDQDEEQVMLRINFSAPGAFARQAEFAKVFRSSLCNDIFPVCSLHWYIYIYISCVLKQLIFCFFFFFFFFFFCLPSSTSLQVYFCLSSPIFSSLLLCSLSEKAVCISKKWHLLRSPEMAWTTPIGWSRSFKSDTVPESRSGGNRRSERGWGVGGCAVLLMHNPIVCPALSSHVHLYSMTDTGRARRSCTESLGTPSPSSWSFYSTPGRSFS